MPSRIQYLLCSILSLFPAAAFPLPVSDSSLVLNLPFQGNAHDESVWHNPVIVHHAYFGPDRYGQDNGAFYCNGANAALEIPPAASLTLPGSLTLATWIKVDEALTTNALVLASRQHELSAIALKFTINGVLFGLYTNAKTPGLFGIACLGIPSPGHWYHCAVSWNAEKKEFRIFSNGKFIQNYFIPIERLSLPDAPIFIGHSISNSLPGEIYKGWIDDLRIYDRALPDSEIEALAEGYPFASEGSTYQKTNQLEPGRYIIANANNKQDSLDQSFRLVVVPAVEPNWKKAWFIALMVLAAVAFSLLGAWFYYRQRHLEQALQFEKIRALEAERYRIAREMHEDIGTGLSALNLLTDMALHKNLEPGLSAEIEHIAAFSHKLSDRIKEIVWAIDMRHDSLEHLLSYLQQHASDFLQHANLELNIVFPARLPAMLLPGNTRRMVFLAFKEALHNIQKHARATRVDIEFLLAARHLEIYIRDNGQGFNLATTSDAGNGLTNMRKRLADTGGEFRVQSGSAGTEIVFVVPL